MNNNRPYEISVWDDVLGYEIEYKVEAPDSETGSSIDTGIEISGSTYGINMTKNAGSLSLEKNENGTSLVYNEVQEVEHKANLVPGTYEVTSCVAKERKIGIVGSSSMTSQHRAVNGKLVSNVNGTNTLTFSLYQKYYDNETGEYVENPFVKLLVNERRIKLRLGNPGDPDVEWFDFVIKNIQESSDSKLFNYTCTDLFINELSKTGFNLVLDGELENNIGTPEELAEEVLKGTGWQLEKEETIHTYHEEPVYKIQFDNTAISLSPVVKEENEQDFYSLSGTFELLGFYSSIVSQKKEIQVICSTDEKGVPISVYGWNSNDWPLEKDSIIVETDKINNKYVRQFLLDGISYDEDGNPSFSGAGFILDTKKRGRRIVRSQITKYDSNLGKYVSRYSKVIGNDVEKDTNGEPKPYWCFTETDKTQLTVLNNYVTNSEQFKDKAGWEVLTKDLDGQTRVSFVSSYNSAGMIKVNSDGSISTNENHESINSWIKMDFETGNTIGNTGLWDYLYDYDKVTKDDIFILLARFDDVSWPQKLPDGSDDYTYPPNVVNGIDWFSRGLTPEIRLYTSKWENGTIVAERIALPLDKVFGDTVPEKYIGWYAFAFKFNQNISHKELVEKELRLCFTSSSGRFYLNGAQLFKRVMLRDIISEDNGQGKTQSEVVYDETQSERYLLPGEFANHPIVFPEYHIYETSDGQDLESMTYLFNTKDITELEKNYKPYYDPRSTARIQVTAKESNRFNILQDIAEAAQCWVKFYIKHNAHTGKIEMDENDKPIKKVSFHKYAGKDNFAGFKYGINLKSIQRTVESNQLASKLIVKPNSNEFADAKQCAIGKAPSNPTKEDIIYNFDYYINHNMIKYETWMEDMYGEDESDKKICYQKRMKQIIKDYSKISEQVVYYSNLIDKLQSEFTTYQEARNAAVVARQQVLDDIANYNLTFGYNDYIELVNANFITIEKDNDSIEITQSESGQLKPKTIQGLKTFCTKNSYQFVKGSIESHFVHYIADKLIEIDELTEKIINYDNILKDKMENNVYVDETGLAWSLEQTKKEYKELKLSLKKIANKKALLEEELYERYHRFIQEGTWISEDYYDNELYYLEACNVSQNSAFPQTSYTINVIDISRVEGYENINFAVGDKTYMQDIEFFGWTTTKEGKKKPYQEEVVCSEVSRVLDDGSQNTIKVQNYKNQFEGLFQRINATTQQVQYKSGEYQKAANAFTEEGELQNGLLSTALENNKSMLRNATNESVTWDNSGISSINLNSPNLITRIVGGGVLVSNDGGETWGHAITGEGINANYLCAGSIDAGSINIRAGKGIPFVWDRYGISAYQSKIPNSQNENFSVDTCVRLDQFGVYGIKNSQDFKANGISINKAEDGKIGLYNPATPFGLTWDGFFFRTGEIGSGVVISSEDDISVKQNGDIRIKIGRINDTIYGICIKNSNGEDVIKQDENGNLSIIGNITAKSLILGKDASVNGTIFSSSGEIGGWKIGTTSLVSQESTNQYGKVGMSSKPTDPAFWAGNNEFGLPSSRLNWQDTIKFYVTHEGVLHATGANIEGILTAGNQSKIGDFIIDNGTLSYNGGGYPNASIGKNGITFEDGPRVASIGSSNIAFKIQDIMLGMQISAESHDTWGRILLSTKNGGSILIYDGTDPGITLTSNNGKLNGTWWCNGATINNSDIRLKNSIQQMDDRYNLLFDNLNPVVFKYNDGQSNRYHTGFIAQETLQAIKIANLTTQDFAAVCSRDINNENAYMGIRYEEFVSLNTWQIQKLKSRVSELESELSNLKQKFETFSNL